MSEKPHNVAIGAFVAGALLIAVTMVIFALGTGFGEQREKVIMVFDGSVKGLSIGAPVALRGVQMGQVTNIELMLDADAIELIMLVEAELTEKNIRRLGTNPDDVTDELIARGLRAQLRTQSLLTGLLYIQLDFHPNNEAILADVDSPHLQIPTVPTDLQVLASKLEEMDLAQLADDVQGTLKGLSAFITSDAFQAIPAGAQASLDSINTLSEQLRQQLASTGPKLDKVLDDAATTITGANAELPRLSDLVQKNLGLLNQAISGFEQTMQSVDSLVSPDSPTTYQLNKALQELTRASRAIQALATTLEQQPEALLKGKNEDTP